MSLERSSNKEAKVSADLSASTTLVSIENLKKGEKLCMGLGRWNPRNFIQGDAEMKTVHFTVRRV